jgi:hypothetical protein
MPLGSPADRGVVGAADRQRAREDDRRVQQSPFGDLVDADDLAVAVQDVRARVDAFGPRQLFVREDRRDAGPDGAATVGIRVADDGGVADAYTVDVGDRIARSGRHRADEDSELARSGSLHSPASQPFPNEGRRMVSRRGRKRRAA